MAERLPVEFKGGPMDGNTEGLENPFGDLGPAFSAHDYPGRIKLPHNGRMAVYELVTREPPVMKYVGTEDDT